MGSCAAIPQNGKDMDASGNTMQCRVYHTGAAASGADLHCPHAGPSGGGACGSLCESFCSIATAVCPTEWPQENDCMTACMGWTAAGMNYNAADYTAGNTTECRLYHLSVAASDAASATMHCPHTVAASPVCM